jgi:ADP-ribosylglycohydrolase
LLAGFEPAPPGHPIAAGMPAGAVTDDTEQAVLLGRLLVSGPVDPRELAAALVAWEHDMAERGSLDLLGPSTRRAVAAVLAGTPPEEAGVSGDTNGAAMRITPVGIKVAPDDPRTLVDAVQEASLVTHNTSVALAGAAAVAAAVSAGVGSAGLGSAGLGSAGAVSAGLGSASLGSASLGSASLGSASLGSASLGSASVGGASVGGASVGGASVAAATDAAVAAAKMGAERGHWVAGADVAARIRWATGLVAGLPVEEAAEVIYSLVGTSLATQESVPAAFAVLSAVPGDPWRACLLAASLGGDCDTIAAMAGAIGGAIHGLAAFPPHAVEVIDAQGLALADLADSLLALRR